MDTYYYHLAKRVILVGVVFFACHLLFPQYTHAASFTEDDFRLERSEMNIANSSELIIFDPDAADIQTASLPQPVIATTTVSTSTKRAVPIQVKSYDPQEIIEYVRQEAINAGIDPDEVEKIVRCESRFNPNAVNSRNLNGTKDMGLWQINSIHRKISDKDKLDYKASTKWAIAKRLHDGNWSAWYCAKRLAIK